MVMSVKAARARRPGLPTGKMLAPCVSFPKRGSLSRSVSAGTSRVGDCRRLKELQAAGLLILPGPPSPPPRTADPTRPASRAADGEERSRLWQRLIASAPTYALYQERAGRDLPVLRLRPKDTAGDLPQP